MAEKNKMDAEVKIRCFLEEKGLLKKSADEVGLSMSDYIRLILFSDKRLILLSEGNDISKALFLIRNDLEYFRSNGGVPKESIDALTNAFKDVSTKMRAISEKLTDLHAENEEVGSDE